MRHVVAKVQVTLWMCTLLRRLQSLMSCGQGKKTEDGHMLTFVPAWVQAPVASSPERRSLSRDSVPSLALRLQPAAEGDQGRRCC